MKLLLAAPAESDLEDIADWIAQDNPKRAVQFVEELRSACASIANMPEAHPLVPRYEPAGIRRKVFGDYLLFYRIKGATVEIIHILHGARDYEPLLFEQSGT